jgi:FAD/FMN-containing dehydrogenase
LLAAHGGRPHWGKRHNMSARDIAASYPMLEQFKRVRAQVDPTNKLANNYLLSLFANG